MPLRLVEPEPPLAALPPDLLLLRQTVYLLRKQKTQVLQPGMLHAQPLWGGIAIMDKAQFEREKERGAMIAIARQMLRRKLITQEEYRKLTQALAQGIYPKTNRSPV